MEIQEISTNKFKKVEDFETYLQELGSSESVIVYDKNVKSLRALITKEDKTSHVLKVYFRDTNQYLYTSARELWMTYFYRKPLKKA